MDTKHITASYRVWSPEMVCYGPLDLPTLVEWVRARRVEPDTWVFCERRSIWAKAAGMDELKVLFDPSQSRPGHMVNVLAAGVSPDILLRIKVFSGLNDDQLQAFIRYMEIVALEPLAIAVREGERGDAMFLILEGEVRARVIRHGKESILATLKAGDFFGEISLLDEGPRSADIVANDRSTLLKISTTAFDRLRREAPALTEPFLHALGQILVGRVRLVNKRYVDSALMLRSLSGPLVPDAGSPDKA